MLDTDTLQPNTSSCGNQPADVSLTLPVETDPPKHQATHPDRHKMSGPGTTTQEPLTYGY